MCADSGQHHSHRTMLKVCCDLERLQVLCEISQMLFKHLRKTRVEKIITRLNL